MLARVLVSLTVLAAAVFAVPADVDEGTITPLKTIPWVPGMQAYNLSDPNDLKELGFEPVERAVSDQIERSHREALVAERGLADVAEGGGQLEARGNYPIVCETSNASGKTKDGMRAADVISRRGGKNCCQFNYWVIYHSLSGL